MLRYAGSDVSRLAHVVHSSLLFYRLVGMVPVAQPALLHEGGCTTGASMEKSWLGTEGPGMRVAEARDEKKAGRM